MQTYNRTHVKVAAIQLEPKIGDLHANMAACERMANEAGEKGAKWIILPEFFTTGMAFNSRIADAIQPPNGKALNLLFDIAKKYQAFAGGSFLERGEDNVVRNTFYLVSPKGILGKHDKDLPTMWENCFYIGGEDDGIIKMSDRTVGSALCWEFMRSQTARRLQGKVDILVGGSCWWSLPSWVPKSIINRWEEKNEQTALESVRSFAAYIGAPIIHAAHAGTIECPLPWLPMKYKGHYEAGSMIVDAEGEIIALRNRHEGQGIVMSNLNIGRTNHQKNIPNNYWLHDRGLIPSFAWKYQRWHGKRWYKNVIAKQREIS